MHSRYYLAFGHTQLALLHSPNVIIANMSWMGRVTHQLNTTSAWRVLTLTSPPQCGVPVGCLCLCLQLLNKRHLAAALDVCEMRDGLVVFECAEDADKFASKLEEEGHSQVRALQAGSTTCVFD
jgi:hypothetical protein